jgi:hypothetical protein
MRGRENKGFNPVDTYLGALKPDPDFDFYKADGDFCKACSSLLATWARNMFDSRPAGVFIPCIEPPESLVNPLLAQFPEQGKMFIRGFQVTGLNWMRFAKKGDISALTTSYASHMCKMIFLMRKGMPNYLANKSVFDFRKALAENLQIYTAIEEGTNRCNSFVEFWDGFVEMSAKPVVIGDMPESLYHLVQQADERIEQETISGMKRVMDMFMSPALGAVTGEDGKLKLTATVDGKLRALLAVSNFGSMAATLLIV